MHEDKEEIIREDVREEVDEGELTSSQKGKAILKK